MIAQNFSGLPGIQPVVLGQAKGRGFEQGRKRLNRLLAENVDAPSQAVAAGQSFDAFAARATLSAQVQADKFNQPAVGQAVVVKLQNIARDLQSVASAIARQREFVARGHRHQGRIKENAIVFFMAGAGEVLGRAADELHAPAEAVEPAI